MLSWRMALQTTVTDIGVLDLLLEIHNLLTASLILANLFIFFPRFYGYIYCFCTLFEAAWAFFH